MSTNVRKTAFARTPRGAAPNPSNDTRGSVRIDKRFLDSLTSARIAPEVSTVLKRADARIHIDIGANGKGEYSLTQKDGTVIGDESDLQKIQILGSFINDERKAVLKESVSKKTKKFLAGMVQMEAAIGVAENQKLKFSKSFLDVFRGVQNQMSTLSNNVNEISKLEVTGEGNMIVKDHIMDCAILGRIAAVRFIVHRATLVEGTVPRKLNDFLLEENCPSWVFGRLTAQKLQLNAKGFELRHLYFPKDPTKGLMLTFREIKRSDIIDSQNGILEGLAPYVNMFCDKFVRLFCGIPEDWDLTDFGEDSKTKALANIPVLIPACKSAISVPEILNALGKQGDRGLPWQAGSGFQPQDLLKFIGTLPKRCSIFCLDMPARKAARLQDLFPGFEFVPTDLNNRGIYAQLAVWAKTDNYNNCQCFSVYDAEKTRTIVKDIMAIPLQGDYNTAINKVIAEEPPKFELGEKLYSHMDLWGNIETTARTLSDERISEILPGRLESSLDPKNRSVKEGAFKTARSSISPTGRQLIADLNKRHYTELADRVGIWLRTFFTVTLQDAVAHSILVRLEAYLANPVKFGVADFSAHFEQIDPGLTEVIEDSVDHDESNPRVEEFNPDDIEED